PVPTSTPMPISTPVPTSAPAASNSGTEGMIFPDSSSRLLTSAECAALSKSQVQDAINEIYARRGYIFEDAGIYAKYKQYSWYRPSIPKSSFTGSEFNSIEYANVELLAKYQ
ncbi:MAG: YARHG domain-containing protein, partial [Eubacteriales bacterium]|nr:YARHG domain-containing protein [Eubacteriales bacterium]